jgi:hypothetical protein
MELVARSLTARHFMADAGDTQINLLELTLAHDHYVHLMSFFHVLHKIKNALPTSWERRYSSLTGTLTRCTTAATQQSLPSSRTTRSQRRRYALSCASSRSTSSSYGWTRVSTSVTASGPHRPLLREITQWKRSTQSLIVTTLSESG